LFNTEDIKVKFLSGDNISSYILDGQPLHKAYQYLHPTHKADYLRVYFMHFYGGGYADIKIQGGSWSNAFDTMKNNEFYCTGYSESKPEDIAHPDIAEYYKNVIGNCAYIFKPNTPFTQKWYDQTNKYLDEVFDKLQEGGEYPIPWARMLGYIFHPICYEFKDQISQDLPALIFNDYR
jgi:hypothetical protein